MNIEYPECSSSFNIPEDSALFSFLTHLAALNGMLFLFIVLLIGPINIAVNCFVMFVLIRKELRSTYNFVFFLMTLNQTILIGTLTISTFKTVVFLDCKPWFFSLFWGLFDLILMQQVIGICKAHATWLAVNVALMRLMSIRSHGTSELQFKLVVLLCGAVMLFVIITNTPSYFSSMIVWRRFEDLCDTKEFGDLLVSYVIESPVVYMNDCLILRLTSIITGTLHSALPCLLLIILSVILLRYLNKMRKDRKATVLHVNSQQSPEGDHTTTLMILIMVTTIISEIPTAIVYLLEGFLSSKMRTQVTSKIELLVASLMLISSACNLFIYLFMSKKFREVAKRYLCCLCRKINKTGPQTRSTSS